MKRRERQSPPRAARRGRPGLGQTVAVYNPISYIADGLHKLIITPGLDWSVLGVAFLTIAAVGFVTLSATKAMFRRTVAG